MCITQYIYIYVFVRDVASFFMTMPPNNMNPVSPIVEKKVVLQPAIYGKVYVSLCELKGV